jgi:predicted transcriptional regulator of viral defense system
VTTDDIRAAVGAAAARYVAMALVRKGALERLKRGLYLIRPFRTLLRPTVSSPTVAVAAYLHAEPYYVGGLWAFTHHGLTDKQYVSILDVFVTRPRLSRTLARAKVVFHVRPAKSMEYGFVQTNIEGVAVRVSDPERTVVDMLDHPRMVGGLRRAVGLFLQALPRIDVDKVADYAVRGSRASTCQRLGVILERAHASPAALASLKRRIKGTRSLSSMLPGPRSGRVNRTWSVVENDNALDATTTS